MSVESTTRLEEEAKELAEGYFNSTPMAELLLQAVKARDYEEVRRLVKWANDIIADEALANRAEIENA